MEEIRLGKGTGGGDSPLCSCLSICLLPGLIVKVSQVIATVPSALCSAHSLLLQHWCGRQNPSADRGHHRLRRAGRAKRFDQDRGSQAFLNRMERKVKAAAEGW